jgi:hypothetical protein
VDGCEPFPDRAEERRYDTGGCELADEDWDGADGRGDDGPAGYPIDDAGESLGTGDDYWDDGACAGDDGNASPPDGGGGDACRSDAGGHDESGEPWYDTGDGDDLQMGSHLLEPEIFLTETELPGLDPGILGGHGSRAGGASHGGAADTLVFSHALQMCSRAGMRRLDIWVPPAALGLWTEAQARVARAAGRPVQPWQCLLAVLTDFLKKWDDPANVELPAGHRIFMRDGYQCTAPGCGARRGLEIHHIVPRSRGGSDDPENLTVLCAAHHRRVLHAGWMRGTGTAPGDMMWELGVRTGCAPLDVYRGDVRIRGSADSSGSVIWNWSR